MNPEFLGKERTNTCTNWTFNKRECLVAAWMLCLATIQKMVLEVLELLDQCTMYFKTLVVRVMHSPFNVVFRALYHKTPSFLSGVFVHDRIAHLSEFFHCAF